MPLSPQAWHQRFLAQARWTRGLREHLFPRIGFPDAERVLDIGCGTGALMEDLNPQFDGLWVGVDIQPQRALMAMRNYPRGVFFTADGHHLPFPDRTFDISLNHYTLMWVADPLRVLQELKRVTSQGGFVLALAEPDYGGRIDHPPPLSSIREPQISSLKQQGADPHLGRKLRGLFHKAGLNQVTTGVFQGKWQEPIDQQEWEMEWRVLKEDLQGEMDQEQIQKLKHADRAAWENGTRTLYLPTFYAWGKA